MTTRKGHHEPLIDSETYERIQERLKAKQKLPARKNLHDDFPLRGFVLCGECGRPYTASWSRGKTKEFAYYRCNTRDCPSCHKSIRADRMHVDFEGVLNLLQPRDGILEGVKGELLAEWKRRMLDVETIRKERQRKLDAIQEEMERYLAAIDRCNSPVVLERIEQKVEELAAKKLRLGGLIAKPKEGDYDFEHALNLVFDFIKNPLLMWQTGDLRQKRLVLRLIFADPLTYTRGGGFGTPTFSPPINIACVPELDKMEMVDQIRKTWNSFEVIVREWAELLGPMSTAV